MRMKKRILELVLCLVLMLGLLPGMSLTAYAQEIRSTELTVGKSLAKDDVIAFARHYHTENDVITYYFAFNLTVYMDGSIVKNVSTPQQNSQPYSRYTVPKKCSVVSYSDNLQGYVHNHILYLKSLEISDATIQVTTTTYDGNAHLPDVTVKNASGETLTYNTDYMLSASQTDVGTYSVTVSGIGNYTGSQVLSDAWSITKGTNSFTTQPVSTILAYTGEQIPLLSNGGAAKWGTIQYSMDNESWSTEIPKKTDVGTYTVYYTVPATENYDEISGMVTVSIIQKPTARNNLTYTGEPQELVTPPGEVPAGYAVQYSLDGTNWSTEIPKGTDVGNYTVKVKYVGDDNHTTSDGEDIPVTIALELTDAQKPKAKDNLTYTGEPQELVTPPGEVPAGYAVQYSLDGTNWSTEIPKGTDVGNYTVKVKYVGDDNHTTSDGEDIPVTIALELTDAQKPKAKDNLTYTGEPQELVTAPTAALPEPYRIVYALGDANGSTEEYTTSIPTATDAGTYYVWYKVVGDKNHNDLIAENPIQVTISKAAVALEWGGTELVYNGTAQAPTATIKSGVADNDTGKVSVEVSGAQTNVNEATSTYTATASLTGERADNYEIADTDKTEAFTIKAKDMTVSARDVNATYDGEAHQITVNVTEPTGATIKYKKAENEEYSETNPTFTNAGVYTVYYKVEKANYNTFTGTANVNITKKAVTVTPDANQSKTYGSKDTAFTYKAEGLVEDETLKGALARAEGENAGEYAYTIGTLATENPNYDVSLAENAGKFAIKKAALKVTADAKSITEGDMDVALTYKAEGFVAGDTADKVLSGALTRETGTKAGTYKITQGTLKANDNYDITFVGADYVIKAAAKPEPQPEPQPTPAPVVTEPSIEEKVELALNAGLKISQTGSKINIKWGKVKEADGYNVYVTYCGSKFGKPVWIATKNTKTKVSITKIKGKKINLTKNFKVYVEAYKKVNGKKEILAKTITGHVVGRKNNKYSNAKKITLEQSEYTVEVGKTETIRAKTVLVYKGKKQLSDDHAKEFRYASSDASIAKVSESGTITGVAKGTCTVYVYARNGYAKKVSVTVK